MKLGIKLALLSFVISFFGVAQTDTETIMLKHQMISFIQNDGQWHDNVRYRTPLGTGSVYLENNVLTYLQLDAEDINTAHDHSGLSEDHGHSDLVDGHAWRATFLGANENPVIEGGDKRTEYHNYFIGNNKDNWASHVPLFDYVNYSGLYSGIDMKVYSSNGSFKYDFIIAPDGNPAEIQMAYTGLDKMEIRDGNLVSFTTVGEFIESAPYAYQFVDGEKVEVICEFVLSDNTVSFIFPAGYDKTKSLVIDPVLVGATLSGGTATNYGHCATYDNDENIYTGARCFGVGYPTDDGSFQTSFAGGGTDISVSKLNPTASALIYATYLGGGGQDLPHSLVVNDDNELYVFGTTRSIDYPVSDGAFDNIGPSGGTSTDIIVTHLSEDGTSVIGSTYVGDEGNDGINSLTSNYGDQYRGEIIVDEDGNCYIASSTTSSTFPTTSGAYQETYGGGTQDAVLFSMPPDLSTMNWSTYIGSSENESGFGLRLDVDGNVYMCGTAQGEFMTMSGYQTTYQGGTNDAFVLKLIDDASSIEYSSYWGTTSKDAAFFLDIDTGGDIYLYGQSDGGSSMVTDGVYSNAGSNQFICSLSANLEDLLFGTVVGAGGPNFIPIAFMVDACGYIYFSGHSASGSLPLTDDALFTTGGFYLGVLEPDAVGLEFATKFSGNHVDGGTSRFDPIRGTVYQAVCSCEDFTTTDDAFGTEHGGFCDIGVFKINFEVNSVHAIAEALPAATGCVPFTVDFENTSSGVSYEWDFDDGSSFSTEFEPTHIFTAPGTYNVRLVSFDPEGCLLADTAYLEIIVNSGETPTASFDYDFNCATGEISITYTGTDGAPVVYDMGDSETYDEPNITHTYSSDGTYTILLTVGDGLCADFATYSVEVTIGSPAVDLIFNNPTCYGYSDGSVTIDLLSPTGDEVMEIRDSEDELRNVDGSNTANLLSSGWYYIGVDLGDGCSLLDSILLVDPPQINAQLSITEPLCYGDKTGYVEVDTVYFSQGDYDEIVYIWTPADSELSGRGKDSLYFQGAGEYTLTINDDNGCTRVFDFTIDQPDELIFSQFGYDKAYCRLYDSQNGNGVLFASGTGGTGNLDLVWTDLDSDPTETTTNSTWGGRNPGNYEVVITDDNGCILKKSVFLDSLNPIAGFEYTINELKTDCDGLVPVDVHFVNTSENYDNPNAPSGQPTFLWDFEFSSDNWLISHDIEDEFDYTYTESGTYNICLVAINKNGCEDTTCTELYFCDSLEFTPINIFSPNADGVNDEFTFRHLSKGVKSFSWVIVNRWGIKIAEFDSIEDGWDGKDAGGKFVTDGVYFYNYTGVAFTGEVLEGQGSVTVVNSPN